MDYKISQWKNKLNRIEPYFFYFFLFLNLIPVFSCKFFPTVDGPAHLYNSRLILELLKDSNSVLNDFFNFNANINPNLTGHILLSLFISIFPAFIAEKIVLLIYLIGLPVSMRYLFNSLSVENKYLLYLVFPFTYSFLFFYGFNNFNIGLVLFFWGLGLWIKYLNELSIKKALILGLISTLICLSHLFVFAIFLMVIFLLNVLHIHTNKLYFKSITRDTTRLFVLQLLALSVGLIITLLYFLNEPGQNIAPDYISFREILSLLKTVSPAKGINYGKANIFTQWIFYIIVAFLLYFIISKIHALIKNRKYKLRKNLWLIISLFILILVFIIPDSIGTGGFIIHRLILFLFLFLIIWLASQKVNFWFRMIIFTIIIYVNFALILHNKNSVSVSCEIARELNVASQYLEPHSTVLPITNSDNFLFNHISNYSGINKPMIILENYEATLNYFPLKWNYGEMPKLLFGDIENDSICINWVSSDNEEKVIDYVLILSQEEQIAEDNCNQKIHNCLESCYQILYEGKSGRVKIYEKSKGI